MKKIISKTEAHLMVRAETHKNAKIMAAIKGMQIRDYIDMLINEDMKKPQK